MKTALQSRSLIRRHETAPAAWSGPLIGRSPEPVDEYLDRLRRRLADPGAHLYFDASFLMWLAKASAAARSEFSAWLDRVDDHRVHVPLWAAHEYFKHKLKRSIVLELGSEISLFESATTSMFEVLGHYASNELFGIESGVESLLDDYRRAIQPVRSLLALATKSTSLDEALQAVAQFADKHLLPGPLSEVVDGIEADERIRNRGVVPPGFKDAHKRSAKSVSESPEREGDNSFGDLVFWREILKHAKKVKASSTIVLTADRKNDWFENQYGDAGFPKGFRKLVPRPRPVPRAHPLLIREAFDRGAGELLLIDPMYCGVLFEKDGVRRENFIRAAFAPSLPELPAKVSQLQSWAGRFGPKNRLFGEQGADEDPAEVNEDFDPSHLTVDAINAHDLPKRATKYLEHIRDEARRQDALSQFSWELLATWTEPEMIAVGAGIFRISEQDPRALAIIRDLREQAPTIPTNLRQCFYFGALGAAYFDDDLKYRVSSGAEATATLLDLVSSDLVAGATTAIGGAVAETSAVFVPGANLQTIPVDVVVEASANGKDPADLLAIRLHDDDLMTTIQDVEELTFARIFGRDPGAFDITVGALLAEVAARHRLPRHLLVPNLDPDATVRVAKYSGVELET